jgi:hypothetical protein
MRLLQRMCFFLFFSSCVYAEPIEIVVERCNQNDINSMVSESQKIGDSMPEEIDIIRLATKRYWQYIHRNMDTDFSLAQSAERRSLAKSYKKCYKKINSPTTFLDINYVIYTLGTGKITNGYSQEFIDARNVMDRACQKTGNSAICNTAIIMSDIDNPNSELIKSIPENVY